MYYFNKNCYNIDFTYRVSNIMNLIKYITHLLNLLALQIQISNIFTL